MATTNTAQNLTGVRPLAVPSVRAVWLEAALAVALLALAVAMRTVNLGVYSGLFDEGIRVEQLYLMSAGFRPFRDIFASTLR